ncbi:MAG: bifunctional glutamate N-acetyltransferase/amino-acid acetyltransferase ArgJ [Dehalococcoidia bacterium]
MEPRIKTIEGGTITSPRGFQAGAVRAGLKASGELDLGILHSQAPCEAGGVFTTNRIQAAPVVLCRKHLADHRAQALVVNSGIANACTGEDGLARAGEMAAITAEKLGLRAEDVLVSSTGVIGPALPMERIRPAIAQVVLGTEGGGELARAMMTTDTRPKQAAASAEGFTIGGAAKGAGMIHPGMATMLAFLATDAPLEPGFLAAALKEAVDISFNMITVDGDTSPNDTVLLMANGLGGGDPIGEGSPRARPFRKALEQVCTCLAKAVVRDGEGATRLIEVTVEGALTPGEARQAARTIAGSPLVKAAVHGSDPNWGRIIAALGRSGAAVEEPRLELHLGSLCLMRDGRPQPFPEEEARAILSRDEVPITVGLNLGPARATAWGCDLSPEYVIINSAYTT